MDLKRAQNRQKLLSAERPHDPDLPEKAMVSRRKLSRSVCGLDKTGNKLKKGIILYLRYSNLHLLLRSKPKKHLIRFDLFLHAEAYLCSCDGEESKNCSMTFGFVCGSHFAQ